MRRKYVLDLYFFILSTISSLKDYKNCLITAKQVNVMSHVPPLLDKIRTYSRPHFTPVNMVFVWTSESFISPSEFVEELFVECVTDFSCTGEHKYITSNILMYNLTVSIYTTKCNVHVSIKFNRHLLKDSNIFRKWHFLFKCIIQWNI